MGVHVGPFTASTRSVGVHAGPFSAHSRGGSSGWFGPVVLIAIAGTVAWYAAIWPYLLGTALGGHVLGWAFEVLAVAFAVLVVTFARACSKAEAEKQAVLASVSAPKPVDTGH
jgi:hypothetical protein